MATIFEPVGWVPVEDIQQRTELFARRWPVAAPVAA
jgi:hypothetical protein